MPNAKVMAGSNRLKQTLRALKDQWLVTEATWGDQVRQELRGPLPRPRSTRPSMPRSTACRRSPRSSTRFAATVPTGVSHCEHVDLPAHHSRIDLPIRCRLPTPSLARVPGHARSRPAVASGRPSASSWSWWPSRAAAEAEVNGARATQDAKVDSEYARTRSELVEKFVTLDREARAADEQRRRAIVDAAMAGEAKAKAEFAVGQPANRRRLRQPPRDRQERARPGQDRGRPAARSRQAQGGHRAHRGAQAPERRDASSPTASASAWPPSPPTTRKFKLDPELPAPSRETYRSSRNPSTSCSTAWPGWSRP